MFVTTKTTGLMLATGLATLGLMQSASALEAQAFVDRIETVYKVMGYDLSFGAATLDGDTVTVDGVTVAIVGVDEEPMKLDTELTFTGVVENEDGSYYADQLTVPDIDTEFAQDPVGRVTVSGIFAEGIWLPPEGVTDLSALVQTVERVATGPLSVTRDGKPFVSYDSLEFSSEFAFDDADELERTDYEFAIANISADLSAMSEEDPDAAATVEALGLTQLNGDISQIGSWSMADGRFTIDQFLLDFADVGALDIAFDITGLTSQVMDKIYAMQAADIDPESEEGQAQQMMLGMEMAQALSINSAAIRYDDAGLAGRMLDMNAAESGAERAEFVEAIKPVIPAMVGQLGVPALTDAVVPAANAFLDDPQSFEISIGPDTATSFMVLAAAAANPAALIKVLNLKVTANEAAAE